MYKSQDRLFKNSYGQCPLDIVYGNRAIDSGWSPTQLENVHLRDGCSHQNG